MALMSDRYRFLFLVNPKTASTSMRRYLRKNVADAVYLQHRVATLGVSVDQKYNPHHNNARIVESLCTSLGKRYDDYFSFAMIRNPWEKMVSRYFYERSDKNHVRFFEPNYDESSALHFRFDDWLTSMSPRGNRIEEFVFNHQGKQLVNKIYPVETFTPAALCRDINEFNANRDVPPLTLTQDLPVTNTTQHAHYSTYYSAESVEIVRQLFRKDIELGRYEFDAVSED
jgi:hypothetical protein